MDQNYSLKFKLGNPDQDGFSKVYLKFYTPGTTIHLEKKVIKVLSTQFDKKKKAKSPIINHPDAVNLNHYLDQFRVEVEARVLTCTGMVTKSYLMNERATADRFVDFIEDFVAENREKNKNANELTSRGKKRAKGKISDGRLRIYEVIRNKIISFDPKVQFKHIDKKWLTKFEDHIRSSGDVNDHTLSSNMTVTKALLGHAKEAKHISEEQYKDYVVPDHEDDIPVYLEEHEIEAYQKMTQSITNEPLKTSGYYFLLACYAGYRISDLKAFRYEEKVRSTYIVLRAKKNGQIVSIPIYPALEEVLAYCKEHTLDVAEETMRKHVKLICRLIGIKNRKVTPHSGRHSFAMMMTIKGLTIDEVAELLGDSIEVARRYARIVNAQLHKRVAEVTGMKRA